MKRLSLISLAFCLIANTALAEEPSCAVSTDHPLIGATQWFGLYYEDTKIGHAMTTVGAKSEAAGEPISHRFEMTFKLEQVEETIAQERNYEAAAPHRLIDGYYQSADRRVEYTTVGHDLHLSEAGDLRVWEGLERTLCEEEDFALHQFLGAEPKIGDEIVTVDFDVEHMALLDTAHTVETISTRRILGADHIFHTLESVSDNDFFSYKATSQYRNGEGINFFLGPIELRVETEAIALRPNTGVDLFAEFEKPLNRPLTDLAEINSLTFKVHVADPSVSIDEVVQDSFLQRVEYLDNRTAIVRLGDHEAPAAGGDVAQFLKPTSAHPSDHPRLIEMADEVRATVADPTDQRALANALVRFVARYIENVPESPYAYNTTSVFDIIDNRTGDCTEHSQLFITLARALGLPARDATGYVYSGDDARPSLGGHAWVEAFVDGRWIGLDPTWDEVELNRSHIQTRNDFVLGLTFEVMDVSYRSE